MSPHPYPTILVVDDCEAVRDVTVRLLKREGYKTFDAADAETALACVAACPSIDIVFTDARLHGESGCELAGKISAIKPALPVILTTGDPLLCEDRHEGRCRNCNLKIVDKPYTVVELKDALYAALSPETRSTQACAD